MSEIAIAIISAVGSIVASIITVISVVITSNKVSAATDAKLDKQQAIMETKIDMLASEVREHNNFARRMPVVEEQIKTINHRIDNLEKKGEK